MDKEILFKIIQRRYKFRNPNSLLELPKNFIYNKVEYDSAKNYLMSLKALNINFSCPDSADYPAQFTRMKEPPLFFEYIGRPLWIKQDFIAVVGSREIQNQTVQWLNENLTPFVSENKIGVVSGGARGVDQLAHLIAMKNKIPTLFVLPSGLVQMYPLTLNALKSDFMNEQMCFLSEFEINQKLHKSHFYFRNRLIAAFGKITFVAQASLKSGSLLTVHHTLEMGKSVVTIPAHPEMSGFDGNLKLMAEGSAYVRDYFDLLSFWKSEG